MRYFIICIITAIGINAFSQNRSSKVQKSEVQQKQPKTVRIKGIDIPLNEIPINMAYKIPLTGAPTTKGVTEGDTPQLSVFASNNKKHFALITPTNFGVKASQVSVIEMYDDNGNLEWKTSQEGFTPFDGQISNSGNSNFLWGNDIEDFYNIKLTLYNNKGDEFFSENNIDRRLTDDNNEIIYYLKDKNQSNNKDDVNTLYCYNSKNKKKWNKKFESAKPFALLTVSGDGNYALCGLVSDGSGSNLYCINKDGEIVWQKDFKENLEGNRLSYNGKFSIRVINSKSWELYSNKGDILLRKGIEKIANYNFLPNYGCFVKNDDQIISITSNVASQKSLVTFYNLKGELLDYLLIPAEGNYYIEATSNGVYQIYFNNIKVQDYQKKW